MRHSERAYVDVEGRVRWYEWVGGGFGRVLSGRMATQGWAYLDVNLVLLVRVHGGGGRIAVGRREKKKRFRDGVVPRSGLRAKVGGG